MIRQYIFYSTVLLLPTQLGYHFWPQFSLVDGIRVDYLSPTLYGTDVLILILVLFYAAPFFRWLGSVSLMRCVFPLAWVLILVVGVVFSLSPLAGWYGLIRIAEMAVFAGIVRWQIHYSKVTTFLALILMSVIGESLLAIAQFLHQGSLGSFFYFLGERMITGSTPGAANASIHGVLWLRPYGTFSHPNTLAGYLLVTSVLMFLRPVTNTRMATLLLAALAIVLSMSRSALLILIVSQVAFFYLRFSTKNSLKMLVEQIRNMKTLKIKILLGVLLLTFIIITLSPIYGRFIQVSSGEESVVERILLIRASLAMIVSHPFFGVGLNNFFYHLPLLSFARLPLQPVHNIFLLVASQTGLAGFVCFLLFLIRTFMNARNSIIKIALLAIVLLGMLDHYFLTSQQGMLLLALVIGLAWSPIGSKRTI